MYRNSMFYNLQKQLKSISLMFLGAVIFISCGGCGSGKNSVTINTKLPDKEVDTGLDKSQLKPTSPKNENVSDNYNKHDIISMVPSDDSTIDEYNVRKYLLEFRSPETHKAIKTIDLVKENPFHKMGLKRRKEPYPAVYYFLMPEGADTKNTLKKFLPKETFKEIPGDFEMDRAISKIFVSTTAGKYVTISYELDWLPDAYSDQGEWDGPGYGVHYVVVYDSLGNKIYTRQFDGTSQMPSVSEDGKYLFTMACLSPEWDGNIRYRFSVVDIKKDKVVYNELIDHCKKNGGGGSFYSEFYNSNGYFAEYKNNHVLGFTYVDFKLYRYLDELKFEIKTRSKNELLLTYPTRKSEIVHIDSLYTLIKLY